MFGTITKKRCGKVFYFGLVIYGICTILINFENISNATDISHITNVEKSNTNREYKKIYVNSSKARKRIDKRTLMSPMAPISLIYTRNHTHLKPLPAIISGSEAVQAPAIDNETHDDTRPKSNVVLFWTNGVTKKWWGTAREGSGYFRRCMQSCVMTRNKSRIAEASVVVFFHVDTHPLWPKIRFQDQIYFHFLNERPGPWHESLIEYNGKINITLCSRRDAEIPTHPTVVRKETQLSDYVYQPKIPLANKIKSVVWAVSHCNASSNRDLYAHELSKYIDVDIYGKCGSLNCSRSASCTAFFERTYKFYLSFENRICKDYITEKYYWILEYELIPIVMGGGDYNEAGPPHSFIDVRDYESPRDLAIYLDYLAHNEEEYYSYFRWKSHYWIKPSSRIEGICSVCDIAHNVSAWSRPARTDYYNWWFSGCDDSLVDNMRIKGNW